MCRWLWAIFPPQKSLGWGFAFLALNFFLSARCENCPKNKRHLVPEKSQKKCHLEMGFATKYSFKNYSSAVTLNCEFICWRDFMEHSFILTLACLKQCWGVLPVRSVHSSFLFSSWLMHSFSLRTLQLLHKYMDRDKVPLLSHYSKYIFHSLILCS